MKFFKRNEKSEYVFLCEEKDKFKEIDEIFANVLKNEKKSKKIIIHLENFTAFQIQYIHEYRKDPSFSKVKLILSNINA